MQEYVKFIEFKILNPEGIIRIWKPKFSMKKLIAGAKPQLEYSKDESESMFDEMFIFIFFGFVAFVGLLVALVAMVVMFRTRIATLIKEKL